MRLPCSALYASKRLNSESKSYGGACFLNSGDGFVDGCGNFLGFVAVTVAAFVVSTGTALETEDELFEVGCKCTVDAVDVGAMVAVFSLYAVSSSEALSSFWKAVSTKEVQQHLILVLDSS
eukprot:CAMPEP_0201684904 /NCGR_PEP_ID=MMETSP0494-20130426/52882_1 /ASSEMBLY_ACC=CAM_ASM_000839 /TAXON_ID=420259 /ORGANISM="Thalassiosira gravida, Strain GMp14c1" /LENGTH=120 /DNA_ID=CAMNT_0048168725 /DNA_START=495 /DNA_END=858 /DNA_ORIENTATION=+